MIKAIVVLFSKNELKKLLALVVLLIFSLFLEFIGLAVLLPLINSYSNPDFKEKISEFYFLNFIEDLNNQDYIILSLLVISFIFLLKFIFLTALNYKQNKFLFYLNSKISIKIFENILNLDYLDFKKRELSEMLKNITADVNHFNLFLTAGITFIIEFFMSIVILIILLIVEPVGTLLVFGFFSLITIVFLGLTKKLITRLGKSRSESEGLIFKYISEALNSFKEININRSNNFFTKKYSIIRNNYGTISAKNSTINNFPRLYLEFTGVIAISAFILFLNIVTEDLSSFIGKTVIFIAGSFKLIPSINRMISSLTQMKFFRASLDVVISNYKQAAKNKPLDNHEFLLQDEIYFSNISLKYGLKEVFSNVNLSIKKGEIIGVLGQSGSGKSTFLDLFTGLLSPSSGVIKIDGVKRNLTTQNWRKMISYVDQNSFLFNESIVDNILFGKEKSDENISKINLILKSLNLKSFLDDHDPVGSNGNRLSGGQKQRISIARAMFKDKDILLFDEPTSSLDNQTERFFIDFLSKFKGVKTIVIVSHKKSTLNFCDKIFEIIDNKINVL